MIDVSHASGSSDSRCNQGGATTLSGREKEPSTLAASKKRKHETGGELVMDTGLSQTVQSSKETKTDGEGSVTVSQSHEDKFRNVCIEDIIILEICAGSARLTKAVRGKASEGSPLTIQANAAVELTFVSLTSQILHNLETFWSTFVEMQIALL